jgi:hypothetical protein
VASHKVQVATAGLRSEMSNSTLPRSRRSRVSLTRVRALMEQEMTPSAVQQRSDVRTFAAGLVRRTFAGLNELGVNPVFWTEKAQAR